MMDFGSLRLWTRRRAESDESGVVLLTVGLSLIALLGLAALAIDGGLVLNERRHAQNAADHAALAAAWSDCHAGDATAAAIASVTRNGYSALQLDLVEQDDGFSARIDVTVEMGFASVVGYSTVDVSAQAVATCDNEGPAEEWAAVLYE